MLRIMANKKKIVASLVLSLLLISVNAGACARDYLFKDGKTSYCIVQSSNASVTEKNAADNSFPGYCHVLSFTD